MTAPANPQETDTRRPFGPHPGLEPRRNPAARWVTILVGISLLALSGLLARELWFLYQDQPFTSWVRPVLDFLGTRVVDATAVTVGIIISVLGLWLIISSFMRRGRTHMQVESPASIWVRPVDVARKSTYAARAEVGGENVRSKADSKRVTVEVEDDGSGHTEELVQGAVARELRHLSNPPAVAVKVLPRTGAAHQPDQPTAAPAASRPAAPQPAETTPRATDLDQVEEELR